MRKGAVILTKIPELLIFLLIFFKKQVMIFFAPKDSVLRETFSFSLPDEVLSSIFLFLWFIKVQNTLFCVTFKTKLYFGLNFFCLDSNKTGLALVLLFLNNLRYLR